VTIRPLPVVAAAAVLVLTGVAHGLRSDRWGVAAEVKAAAARLDGIPHTVGDWEGKPLALDEGSLRIAQLVGYNAQTFTHRVTAEKASVIVLCGRPGPIGSHTPDVCYQGMGMQMEGEAQRQTVQSPGGLAGEFWTARFVRTGPVPEALRIWWAWGTAGEWGASASPRLALARNPALYKIYVVSPSHNPGGDLSEDSGRKLIEALLPELRKELAPGS
jgi:hypothetical protein